MTQRPQAWSVPCTWRGTLKSGFPQVCGFRFRHVESSHFSGGIFETTPSLAAPPGGLFTFGAETKAADSSADGITSPAAPLSGGIFKFGDTQSAAPPDSAKDSSSKIVAAPSASTSGIFGDGKASVAVPSIFGAAKETSGSGSSIFGEAAGGGSSIFGSAPSASSGSSNIFGAAPSANSSSPNIFGGATPNASSGGSNIFGSAPSGASMFGSASSSSNAFGGQSQSNSVGANLFGGPGGNAFGGSQQSNIFGASSGSFGSAAGAFGQSSGGVCEWFSCFLPGHQPPMAQG